MAGFEYRGQLNGAENPVTLSFHIGNSQTVKVGDAVNLDTVSNGGGVMRADAGDKVLGIVVGITDKNGIDLDNTSTANYDGTWTSSTKVYAATSDNRTDKIVKALVVVDKNALWYNDTAATLTSAHIGKYCDLTDQDQIASTTPHDTAGAFVIIKIDPDGDGDASKAIVKIAEDWWTSASQG